MTRAFFQLNSAGVKAALSSPGVRAYTYAKAQEIADRANAMCGDPTAYAAHQGANSDVGISNVSTASRHGRADNSVHHTLQKAGGL